LDVKDTSTFDLVTLRGTIEHFPDPVAVLEKSSQLLKTGGYLYITATPAGDSFAFDVYREKWQLFTPIVHIHFFSVALLTRLLSRFNMIPVVHHYQYEETSYANRSRDFKQIQEDIIKIRSGQSQEVKSSVPFPGSVMSALWVKK
jgi:SAM-dependent methyltransferase